MAQVSGDSGQSITHSATFANDRVCLFDRNRILWKHLRLSYFARKKEN